ncbi:MAG TPA: saccharopine dehydrogenase C-terminal domain-containing protein, partial [Lentimicrobium sp.]|nr:saccharopine dehydrogenase C-terminal domain-containing protein [Lentimicrobium sp.]
KEVIRSRMLDFGTPATDTSIARTVALPAAIGVEMILNGEIGVKGVFRPVIPEIYNPVLDALEKLDIRMEEEYGLPESENIR